MDSSDEQQHIERFPFTVTTRRGGHRLSCLRSTVGPPHDDTNGKTVVLCHGLLSTKDTVTLVRIERELLKPGHLVSTVVRFDFHGNGASEGLEQWSLGGYDDDVEDLQDVVTHLRSEGETVCMVVGHSRASTVVLMHAAQYGGIPLVVSLSGRWNLSEGIYSHFSAEEVAALQQGKTVFLENKEGPPCRRPVTPQCIQRRLAIDLTEVTRQITPEKGVKALLVVHGAKDTVVPVTDALIMKERLETNTSLPVELVILQQGAHSFGSTDVTRRLGRVLTTFLRAHI